MLAVNVIILLTVRLRGMGTGISEASKRVPMFSFATQGGKQVSSHFRQRNWVQAREAQIRFSWSSMRGSALKLQKKFFTKISSIQTLFIS
jgi:hypothetical protein